MYRFIIPPSYILAHLILFFILNWWLDRAFINYHEQKRWRFFLLGAILLLSLPALLGCYLSDCSFRFAMMASGNLWLGFFFYWSMMALVLSAIAALTGFLRLKRTPKSRSHARILLLAAVIAAIPVYIYGLYHAQDVRVHKVTVDLGKEVKTEDGADSLKVVLIGDLHMSVNSRPRLIRDMVDRINEQDADLVLIAGDFLTSTYYGFKDPGLYAEILRGIRSRYGTYAVYGNHDVEEPLLGGFPMTPISEAFRSEEIISFIGSCGFTVMSDNVEEVPGAGVVIVGREDGEKSGNG
ncbi:MAG: metallophosphoesterase, partial [Lachnospiraceae bacterium]|nr:metallophosphoesterase [Lachnospiraceae bacterium]